MAADINHKPVFKRNSEYVCIEYPGIIANDKNMLATLGGLEHVEEVYNDTSKRLDLKFRPDDPSCKPLCADRLTTTSLLLKVCKYRRKKKKNDMDGKENVDEYKYRQTICGILNSVYRFSTLCDYQFVSLRKNETTGGTTNVVPFFCVDDTTLKDDSFFTQNVSLFLPPPTFGRLDTPHDYHYKQEHVTYRRAKQSRNRKSTSNKGVSSRKSRPNYCISLMYEDEVPTKCLPQALDVFEAARALVGDTKNKIAQGFQERPVWSRNALHSHFGCSLHFLRIILPVCAYYVVSGPWSRLWIRFGYEPKIDPHSKIYQLIDFRLRQGIHTPHIPIKAKRSALNYKLPHLSSKAHLSQPKSGSSFTKIDVQSSSATSEKTIPESVYIYQPGVLPAHRQIFYQACDIHLPEAQELMRKSVSPDMKCTKEDGWLLPNTTAEIRNLITKDIFKTLSIMKFGSAVEAPKNLHISSETYAKHKEMRKTGNTVMDKEFNALDDDEIEERNSDDSEETSEEETTATSQDDGLGLTEIDADDDDEFEAGLGGEEDLYFDDDEFFDSASLLDNSADGLTKDSFEAK